ncbi:MAG TPA: hypothetical protein VF807_08545 [Ktedonobacterales bacterium]
MSDEAPGGNAAPGASNLRWRLATLLLAGALLVGMVTVICRGGSISVHPLAAPMPTSSPGRLVITLAPAPPEPSTTPKSKHSGSSASPTATLVPPYAPTVTPTPTELPTPTVTPTRTPLPTPPL